MGINKYSLTQLVLGLGFLTLTGCASLTANYYTQTVRSWHNGKTSKLIERWGAPDEKITSPSGNTLYIYQTESYNSPPAPLSPPVGVHYSGNGRPVIVNMQNTNNVWSRPLSIPCYATFEANAKGVIVKTQVQGSGCYGGPGFASRRGNPG